MAAVPTALDSDPGASSQAHTSDWTTGLFTPAAGGVLVIGACGFHDGTSPTRVTSDETIGVSGGSLTWTKRVGEIYNGGDWGGVFVVYTAPVGGSPSEMSITIDLDDPDSGSSEWYMGWNVFEITGHDSDTPAQTPLGEAEAKGGGDSESHTHDLGAAPTSGELVVGIFFAENDTSGTFAVPTGFTANSNLSGVNAHSAVFHRDDTTDDEIICTDLGQGVFWVFSADLVYAAAAAAAVYPPFPSSRNRRVRI